MVSHSHHGEPYLGFRVWVYAGVSGRVSVNGAPLAATTMQRLCGYVLQDDVLPGTSTVQEYLM